MLQHGFVASYYAESIFIELINNERNKSRKTQNGSFQDIQTGYRQKTRRSARIFLAWNHDDRQQNGYIIASKAEPHKVKLSDAEQYCSERNDKYESESNRRNAERQKSRRKAQKECIGA